MAWINSIEQNRYRYDTEAIVLCMVLVVFISDVVLSALFVLGGLKKNLKCLQMYYYYSIGLCLLMMLLTAVILGLSVQGRMINNYTMRTGYLRVWDFTGYFVNVVLQAFFVHLLRGEIIKLKNSLRNKMMDPATMQYVEASGERKRTEYLRGKETENLFESRAQDVRNSVIS